MIARIFYGHSGDAAWACAVLGNQIQRIVRTEGDDIQVVDVLVMTLFWDEFKGLTTYGD